jgi:hypothetical protein
MERLVATDDLFWTLFQVLHPGFFLLSAFWS